MCSIQVFAINCNYQNAYSQSHHSFYLYELIECCVFIRFDSKRYLVPRWLKYYNKTNSIKSEIRTINMLLESKLEMILKMLQTKEAYA